MTGEDHLQFVKDKLAKKQAPKRRKAENQTTQTKRSKQTMPKGKKVTHSNNQNDYEFKLDEPCVKVNSTTNFSKNVTSGMKGRKRKKDEDSDEPTKSIVDENKSKRKYCRKGVVKAYPYSDIGLSRGRRKKKEQIVADDQCKDKAEHLKKYF